MTTAVSVETMRKSDAYTIAKLTDSKTLMYRAGKGVFESRQWKGKTAIVCGTGNNAGDGYVLALLLKEANIDCKLFLLKEKFSEDGKYYFDKCVQESIPYAICDENTYFYEYSEIVDCIFGTGFKGEVKGLAGTIIDRINDAALNADAYVVSVDINSGLDGDCGTTTRCVCSHLTVSIGSFKTGHFLNMGSRVRQKLVNCDIGIEIIGEQYYLANPSIVEFDSDVDDPDEFDDFDEFDDPDDSMFEPVVFSNLTEFYAYAENCISHVQDNPVQFISDCREYLIDDVLVHGFGDCSVYADDSNTYILMKGYSSKEW